VIPRVANGERCRGAVNPECSGGNAHRCCVARVFRVDRLGSMEAFIRVIETGSFSAAAQQMVDERAALDAEGAANRGLGGAAVERRDHRRELLGVDCRAPPARRRCPEPQRSRYVCLRYKNGLFVSSGQYGKIAGYSLFATLSNARRARSRKVYLALSGFRGFDSGR
jgi:hypothetical protein